MKTVLFYFWQFTWGFLQNFVGLIGFLALRGKYKQERFHRAFVTYVTAKNFGGVSFGMFIFVNPSNGEEYIHDTRIHEYGHTVQSLLLGPLYLIVIGIPSSVWCNFAPCIKYRKKNNVSYYWLFCEGWANIWGLRWSGEKAQGRHMLETGRYGKPL